MYIYGPPRGLGDLGRVAIYSQGSGDALVIISGIWGASSWFGDLGSPAKSKIKISP